MIKINLSLIEMENINFTNINFKSQSATSLREKIYKYLKQEILNGNLVSENILVESQLVDQIGTSRTPVREALHFLEKEGLLEILPKAGYRVRGISLEEFEEISEIRRVIEQLAVQWAIQKGGAEKLEEMRENLKQSEARIKEEDWGSFVALDAQFHELVGDASGSRRLQDLIRTLRGDMVRYRVKSLKNRVTASVALKGHKKILQAIVERDDETAKVAVRKHLEEANKYIKSYAFSKGADE
jgi:DNA-binding GntR family transcriptional regulator